MAAIFMQVNGTNRETALQLYAQGKLSLSEAANVAELSIEESMETQIIRCIKQEIPKELPEESLQG